MVLSLFVLRAIPHTPEEKVNRHLLSTGIVDAICLPSEALSSPNAEGGEVLTDSRIANRFVLRCAVVFVVRPSAASRLHGGSLLAMN